jgi:hypothetical protein
MGMLVLIIGAQGALEFFAIGKYKALFTADQKSYVISLINALGATINAIIIIVLVRMHLILCWSGFFLSAASSFAPLPISSMPEQDTGTLTLRPSPISRRWINAGIL